MPKEKCNGFKEFPIIIEAKDHPIHAWLPHPEAVLKDVYADRTGEEGETTFEH